MNQALIDESDHKHEFNINAMMKFPPRLLKQLIEQLGIIPAPDIIQPLCWVCRY